VVAGGVTLEDGEYQLVLAATQPDRSAAIPGGRGIVVLDTEVTPELAAEGTARDVVRLVQQARRDAGLHISDRIVVSLGVPDDLRSRLEPFVELITDPTLALELRWVDDAATVDLDGWPVHIGVQRVTPNN
jgi:isoleucyl-tRNA synthetase